MSVWNWLTYWDYVLIGVMALMFGYQLFFYFRYLLASVFRSAPQEEFLSDEQCPGVSVIVCARNEQTNLTHYLPALLSQDYPKFEVIVVDDESEDDSRRILEEFAQVCNQLYITFVPKDANVVSSKKLAITLGVKAAKYEYILLTDADCRPESNQWIRRMMQGFVVNPAAELVLGVSPYFPGHSLLHSMIDYDTLFTALQYTGMAKVSHPYMGVGRNLAYKREIFFQHNGFSGLLNYRSGDDDLFVNKIATAHNTVVVNSPDSLTWSPGKNSWKEWFHQKRRHLSVGTAYKNSTKWMIGAEPITRGVFYLCMLLSFIFGTSLIGLVAYTLWLIRLIVLLVVLNCAARRLGVHYIGIEAALFDISLPLISLWILLTQPFYRKRLYW